MLKKKHPRGITLIELTVALAMFSIVMVIAVDSFNSVMKASRESVQKQALQDHAEFLFNLMTKEIKYAKINTDNKCDPFFKGLTPSFSVGDNQLYAVLNTTKQDLRFVNYKGVCVRYFLETDTTANSIKRLKVQRFDPNTAGATVQEAWITPLAINVENLFFEVTDMVYSTVSSKRRAPSVSYYLKLQSVIWNPPTVDYFNFVTARNIEQF